MLLPESPLWRLVWVTSFIGLLLGCQATSTNSSGLLSNQAILDINTPFRPISSTTICSQTSCADGLITAAEILAVSGDGMTLIYTDSPRNSIGFLDISDPAAPKGLGRLALNGEPTSIATKNNLALVAVTTSSSPEIHDGELVIIDIASQAIKTTFDLPGQPDSVAVSPDKNYAIVAIENERSYDINDGVLPQLPSGEVVTLDLSSSEPANWQLTRIDITGLATIFPEDPEPEYVDINQANQAVVTLQENNHAVVINLVTSEISSHFSLGSTIKQVPRGLSGTRFDMQVSARREPDGVSWLANEYIVTADEGDYVGGTDTISIFSREGEEVWTSGDTVRRVIRAVDRLEQTLRSGAQPENIEVATFANGRTYLFANIERGDIVLVYDASIATNPELIQVLDTPKGPEGGLAIPSRGLFLVASEDDLPSRNIRSQIHIFELVN